MNTQLHRAAAHALASAAAFAATAAFIKAAADSTSNEVVVFVRCAVGLMLLLPWLARQGLSGLATKRPMGHLARTAFGLAAMYCFFYAISALPLATAMVLSYSTPLWVPLIAWAWLRERPAAIVAPSLVLGLAGILLIIRPEPQTFLHGAAIIGLASGLLGACAMVGIRNIVSTEPVERIVFYFALLSTAISAVPMLLHGHWPPPLALLELVAAGVCATLGQLQTTRAYGYAPAALVGPFTYTSLIFSAALAWWIWDEHLDLLSLLGSSLVVASCVVIGVFGRRIY